MSTVIAFPSNPTPRTRFTPEDRNAIIGAALAVSPRWGASFGATDTGADTATVGPLSGGDDHWQAEDAYGLTFGKDGLIELADLRDWNRGWTFHTVGQALDAMRQVADARR